MALLITAVITAKRLRLVAVAPGMALLMSRAVARLKALRGRSPTDEYTWPWSADKLRSYAAAKRIPEM
jgi:hypothetical protein